ncbi:MAG: hypothetical protein PHE55_03195, partial [Methylococcaceae bacterium]|nr:hypothetical protein [Methylococcaceae bacterium]
MKKNRSAVSIGFAASMLFAAISQAADNGNKAGASFFQENPKQDAPALELQRLRNEGVAKYESGLALDEALQEFRRAFEMSGQAADAFNVALVHFKKNDVAGTRKWLSQALQKDANFPNAH